jgi:hypothetical protein
LYSFKAGVFRSKSIAVFTGAPVTISPRSAKPTMMSSM